MATLERIRQRSGLLIIVIGLAMLAFILTDFLSSGNSIFQGDANVVGKINGEVVDINQFSALMDETMENYRQQSRGQVPDVSRKQLADAAWELLLREKILGKQYDKLGFKITPAELAQRIKDNPNIQSAPAFKDQVTGAFSDALLQQYLDNMRDNISSNEEAALAWKQWVDFEEAIKEESLTNKYNEAVQKGLYVPTGFAREDFIRNNSTTDFSYVMLPYSDMADSTVEIDEADYKDYYKEHKEDLKSEKTSSIQYVNFPITPSALDLKDIRDELNTYLKEEIVFNKVDDRNDTLASFANTEDDSAFAVTRSDLPVTADYFKKETGLIPELDTLLFDKEVGYIHGPYEDNGYYKLTKISDIRNIPDSVKARHILISFQGANEGRSQATRSPQEAQALADSLLDVVKNDTSKFAEIARSTSDDPGSAASDGDLGWFDDKTMVPSFSRFCFTNDVGDISIVFSTFGFHIIEILDQKGTNKGVKLVNIAREINPSDKTFDSIYNQASQFATQVNDIEEFSSLAEQKGYSPRPVTNLVPFDESIPGLGQRNRDIVRWIFKDETNIGDIQLFNNNNQSSVVVIVTSVKEEGYPELESIKEEIKPDVIQAKKAKVLAERLAKATEGNDDLKTIASLLGTSAGNHSTSFDNLVIPGVGREPKVTGAVNSLEPNIISQPVKGERGVFLVQVTNRKPAQELQDYKQQQQQLANTVRNVVPTVLFTTLKDQAKIDDRRARFY